MTVAEMKISNRERLNKLEALDPEKLNDILDYVFSKLVPVSLRVERNDDLSDVTSVNSENIPNYFGMWKENGDEIKELIYKSRTKNSDLKL